MQKTIISDTSCLILLDKIDQIHVLKLLFGGVVITSIIAEEFGKDLPEWIQVLDPILTIMSFQISWILSFVACQISNTRMNTWPSTHLHMLN